MTVQPDSPNRKKDRWEAIVAEWQGGCIRCGSPETGRALPGSGGRLDLPLCERHLRWALASRRERIGKQAGELARLLLAWCRYRELDRAEARRWLGY